MNVSTKIQMEQAARLIHEARLILDKVEPELTDENDIRVLRRTRTDLNWATENCTVIGLHSIGQALDDKMGE